MFAVFKVVEKLYATESAENFVRPRNLRVHVCVGRRCEKQAGSGSLRGRVSRNRNRKCMWLVVEATTTHTVWTNKHTLHMNVEATPDDDDNSNDDELLQ